MPGPGPATVTAAPITNGSESLTSTAPAEDEAKIKLELQKAFEETSKILKENSGRIQFDQKKAKTSFQEISSILGGTDQDGREFTTEEVAKIKKIGDEATDCGLKIFASVTSKVLGLDGVGASDKLKTTNDLKTNFAFLGEDDYAGKNGEEISGLIIDAVKKTTQNHKDKENVVNAINSGFKEAFPAEEERAATEKQNIMPGALKGVTALTLALAVPPPLGVILALGFLAYTWNMGHEPEEKKPEIFNDPDVQEYAEAWKKYMKPQQEITDEDRENYEKDQTALGKVASRFTKEAETDLSEGKKPLKNTGEVLKTSREKLKKTSIAGRSPPALEGEELGTGGTGGEELQELMDRSPVADSEQKAVLSEDHFASFVEEEGGELSEEESKELSSDNLDSMDDFQRASEGLFFPATVEAEAKAVAQELAASLKKGPLTSTEGTILPAGKNLPAIGR